MIKKLLILGLLSLILMAVMLSCAPEELDGTKLANIAPAIHITNIDYYDSLYTYNAIINWFGTDEDGQVMYYYYNILPYETVGDSLAALTYIQTEFADIDISEWTQTEETEATINMLASNSETDTLHQYVFFMCEDDEGAYSNIGFYALYRINRLPQTTLELLPGNYVNEGDTTRYKEPVWSLLSTTDLWDGLPVSWMGDDTLDFPDGAPDFEYSWKLYGPFSPDYYDTSTQLIDIGIENVLDEHIIAMSCADGGAHIPSANGGELCDDPWVWSTEFTLTGLPTGCYLFSVQTRDDALVPDPTPDWGTFIVYMPVWESNPTEAKDIMLIRASQYLLYGDNRKGFPLLTDSSSTANYPDSLLDFYTDMIQNAGYEFDPVEDVYGSTGNLRASDYPSIDILAQYRMIIFDDMDYHKRELGLESTGEPFISVMMDYMDAGGKAWVIGRQCFIPNPANYSGSSEFAVESLAYKYFDLSAGVYTEVSSADTAEFIGATSNYSTYADLPIDQNRTMQMNQININKVEILVRFSPYSRTLFTYNAANPDTLQDLQYLPCAVRFQPSHDLFRSSYFSFPLYMMDNSQGQVQTIFTDMLNWFLTED